MLEYILVAYLLRACKATQVSYDGKKNKGSLNQQS